MTESADRRDSALLLHNLGHELRSRAGEVAGSGNIEHIHYVAKYRETGYILNDSNLVPAFEGTSHCDVHVWRSPDGVRKIVQKRNGRPQPSNPQPTTSPPQVEFNRRNPLRAVDTESALSVISSTARIWKERIIPPWLTSAILIELSRRPAVEAEVAKQNGRETIAISVEGTSFDELVRHVLIFDRNTAMPSREYVLGHNSDSAQTGWAVVDEVCWLDFSRVESFGDIPVGP